MFLIKCLSSLVLLAGLACAATPGENSVEQTELVALGREAFSRGDFRAASEHWSIARHRVAVTGRAESVAVVATNLALLEYRQGNHRAALAGYREALRHWETLGQEGKGLRVTLFYLAEVLRVLGEYGQARQMLGRLSRLLERAATQDPGELALLRLGQARIQYATGQIASAADLFRELLDSPAAAPSVRGAAWDGLGEVRLAQGNFVEADRAFQEALLIWESTREPLHAAGTLNRLGDCWLSVRKPRQSLAYLQRALAIFKEQNIGGAQLASTLNSLGQASRFNGNAKAASHYFAQAHGIATRELAPDHPILAAILLNLGDFSLRRKKYDDAERYLRQALTVDELHFSRQHPAVARDLARLANLHLRRKQRDAASREFGEALAIYERNQIPLGAEHADWLERRAGLLRRGENFAEAAKLEAKAMRIRVRQALR